MARRCAAIRFVVAGRRSTVPARPGLLLRFRDMPVVAQELGGAGTLQGTVKDPTGGVMTAVTVNLSQPSPA